MILIYTINKIRHVNGKECACFSKIIAELATIQRNADVESISSDINNAILLVHFHE